MNRPFRNILLTLLVGLSTFIGFFLFQSFYTPVSSASDVDGVTIVIPKGASFSQVVDSLERHELIGDRISFEILGKIMGVEEEIKTGSYRFGADVSHHDLLSHLKEGRSAFRVKVTFPEGVTIKRIASIARKRAGIDSSALVRLANDRTFLRSMGLNASTAEGYLMPDTYFVDWGVPPEVLLREMILLFRAYYTDEKQSMSADNNLTPYETIILASLVEGEAKTEGDRPIIAGLYLNRLRKGMLLQADPTIQYILPDGPRRLLYEDLKVDNPYNTYKYSGLPPTPINSPGRASIDAALNPAETDYIYMVAKGDGSGEHSFTRTLSEHQQAVRQFRKNRAARE